MKRAQKVFSVERQELCPRSLRAMLVALYASVEIADRKKERDAPIFSLFPSLITISHPPPPRLLNHGDYPSSQGSKVKGLKVKGQHVQHLPGRKPCIDIPDLENCHIINHHDSNFNTSTTGSDPHQGA